MLNILIVFFSLIALIIIHEFGHFIIAKKLGVRVDEFGIGLPPRIFGKKVGETIYSLNLLPFGGFVKIYGEEKGAEDSRSFSSRSVGQRSLIIVGGVLAFWIIAFVLLSIVFGMGVLTPVSDDFSDKAFSPRVQILSVSPDSPADRANIKSGDIIKGVRISETSSDINKVAEIQEFTNLHKGEEITLIIQRGGNVLETVLVPRTDSKEDEGPMGVALVRVIEKAYPWYQAPIEAAKAGVNVTGEIIKGFGQIIGSLVQKQGLPDGARMVGPVGITVLMSQAFDFGLTYFLQFMAVISIYLAIFNILPIPALDGGKLLFLMIEKIKGSPVSFKIEQGFTTFFFALLLLLMAFFTFKDIQGLF